MTRTVSEQVRREAELWFARRREPAVRDAQAEAFDRWRSQDATHVEAYADAERLWDQLAALQRSERLQALASQLPAAPLRTRLYRAAVGPALLAAGLAALVFGAVLWFSRQSEPLHFVTALGEQRTEALPDGTTLRLNTQSAVDVRMTSSRRDLALSTGEAAFDVAKDAARPFVVTVGGATVTALGTYFQVRHDADRVAVTLLEGHVQVARPAQGEVEWLEPGQQASFSEGTRGIVRQNVDVKALTSWMNGRLEFRSTTLAQAVAEVNRYSARRIRIDDPAIGSIEVSGTFRTGDAEGAAAAFEAAFPVRADIGVDEIILRAGK